MADIIKKLRSKVFYEVVNGQKVFIGGLKPDTRDPRDLQVGGILQWMGLEAYVPKAQRFVIQTLSIKNQSAHNTCGWFSSTLNKEKQEGIPLSARGLVKRAKKEGMLSENGYSQLRDNMKVINQFGIPEEKFLPQGEINDNWEEFSRFDLTPEAIANALSHKSASYAQIRENNKRNETLKALDEGLIIHTGSPWYDDFNMRGGFSAPWLITGVSGFLIGGHAFEIIGYDLNYQGRKVYVCQNSYGAGWGDNGKFYVDMDFADKFFYSRWTQLDIPVDTARFLQAYSGRNVRVKGANSVWLITSGQRFAYPNWLTFLAHLGLKEEILVIEDQDEINLLNVVPRGADMRLDTAPLYPVIREMSAPDNYKKLLELNARQGVGANVEGWLMSEIFDEIAKEVAKIKQ